MMPGNWPGLGFMLFTTHPTPSGEGQISTSNALPCTDWAKA